MWIPGAPSLASLVQMASSKSSERSLSKITVKGDREKHPTLASGSRRHVRAYMHLGSRACAYTHTHYTQGQG